MTSHSLQLFGEPAWTAPSGTIRMPGRKPAALLWYLAAHPGTSFARGQLASLFWGGQAEADAKANLTKSLSRLRLVLPVWPLQQTRHTVAWQADASVRTDLNEFLALTEAGDLASLRKAAALWRGPFLAGFDMADCPEFEQWLLMQREALARRQLAALAALADAAAAAADWTELERWCEQALAIDRLQERFHRGVMQALAGRGDRNAAVAHYNRYRQLLLEELGVEPEPSTVALRDQLVAGEAPVAATTPPGVAAAIAGVSPAPMAAAAGAVITATASHAPDIASPASGPKPSLRRRPAPANPLVGREQELADVLRVINQADNGPAPIAFLHGEAGIGKTRLTEEVIKTWEQTAGTLLLAPCYKETSSLPYVPIATALTQAERLGPDTGQPLPEAYTAALAEFLPEFEQSGMPAGAAPSHDPGAGRSAFQVWQRTAHLLELLPGPVLFVIEDLHKADDDTLQLLAFLARRPPRQRLALLVTGRKGAFATAALRLLRELEREQCLVWLELGPLPAEAIGQLAAFVLGAEGDPAAAPGLELTHNLYARSGGSPLFTIELLRAWQQAAAALRDGRVQPSPPPLDRIAIDSLPLPNTLHAVIDSRFDPLTPSAAELLAAAAIFGRPVSLDCLQHVADLSADAALAALDELLQAEVLQETAQGITFKHELLRQGAASRISKARSQQLHRRAYAYLLNTWAAAAGVDPAAYHREQLPWTTAYALGAHAFAGGLWEEALVWNEAGALSCLRTFRMPIATHFMWRTLQCLVALPETPERREQLTTLALALTSDFLMFAGNPWHPKPEDVAFEAADLTATSSRPPIHAARAALAGDYATVRAVLEHMLTVIPDEPTHQRAAALRAYGGVLVQMGDLQLGITTLQQSAALDRELGHQAASAVSQFALSTLLAETGAAAEAQALLARLQAAAAAAQDETLLATAQSFVALAALALRDWDAVADACEAAMARASEVGFQYVAAFARLAYGPMLFARGDLDAAIEAQQQTVVIVAEQERGRLLALSYAWLAEILAAAGRTDEAAAAAQQGWEFAAARDNSYGRALCARARGLAAAAAGDVATASDWLQQARDEAAAIGAVPLVGQCDDALAKLAR